MENNRFIMGLSLLTLSTKYLYLVKNVLNKSIESGNPHVLFTSKMLTGEKYAEITKWSDFNISIPVLFNFYHGLELLLKGFLILKENCRLKANHNIKRLFEEFKKNYNKEEKITAILKKYLTVDLMPNFLAQCLKNNNIEINYFYNFLRYPSDKNFQNIYNYIDLKYKEEKGLVFFKELEGDLTILLKEAVGLYRDIEKDNKLKI